MKTYRLILAGGAAALGLAACSGMDGGSVAFGPSSSGTTASGGEDRMHTGTTGGRAGLGAVGSAGAPATGDSAIGTGPTGAATGNSDNTGAGTAR